jgi:hypothetical protein
MRTRCWMKKESMLERISMVSASNRFNMVMDGWLDGWMDGWIGYWDLKSFTHSIIL